MMVLLSSFILMVTYCGFIHELKSQNHLVQHNKQYLMKVLLNPLVPKGSPFDE